MSTTGEDQADAAAEAHGGAGTATGARMWLRVFVAGATLAQALRRVVLAAFALLAADAAVLRASAVLLFLGSVALVALTVSLWACVVALIGWALMVATHSIGIALAILVALHLVLVIALWHALKYAWRQATFPASRAELRGLGRELRDHVERFQHAVPRDRRAAP